VARAEIGQRSGPPPGLHDHEDNGADDNGASGHGHGGRNIALVKLIKNKAADGLDTGGQENNGGNPVGE